MTQIIPSVAMMTTSSFFQPDHSASKGSLTTVTSEHPLSDNSSVRAYYEQNSVWFTWMGRRQHSQVIHRPVWAEGVLDQQTALNYVNERISHQVQEIQARPGVDRVDLLDLGCGFGGTIRYLERQWGPKILAIGLTISAQQAQAAQRWADERGVDHSCAFLEADFHAVPLVGQMDLALSIEAFAHAIEPERYFAEAARLLKPGGRLILCDDFQSDRRALTRLSKEDQRWLEIFKKGWHVPRLLSCEQVTGLAQDNHLHMIGDFDLSPYLRIRSFPRELIPLFERAIEHKGRLSPLLESVVGGWALEHSIRQGNVSYRFLVFEKQASKSG
jgi:SAM-dependent methyltransferase